MRQSSPDAQGGGDGGCSHGITSLHVKRTVARLRAEAGAVTVPIFVERSILFDPVSGLPTWLSAQRDGPPCGNPRCPYAYFLAVPHRSLAGALHAAAARAIASGEVARHFARLSFADAVTVDATGLPEVAEHRIDANDPLAHEHIRAMRDAAIDAAWIPSDSGGPLMLLFSGSIGLGVVAEYERSRYFDGTRWHGDGFMPGGFDDRHRMLVGHRSDAQSRLAASPNEPAVRRSAGTVRSRLADALACYGGLAVKRC